MTLNERYHTKRPFPRGCMTVGNGSNVGVSSAETGNRWASQMRGPLSTCLRLDADFAGETGRNDAAGKRMKWMVVGISQCAGSSSDAFELGSPAGQNTPSRRIGSFPVFSRQCGSSGGK
jgi:hypothetical protein